MFCTFAHQNLILTMGKVLERPCYFELDVELSLAASHRHVCSTWTRQTHCCKKIMIVVKKSAKFLVSGAEDKSKLFQGWCLCNLNTWKAKRCTAMYLQPSGGTLSKSLPAWSILLLSRYGREDLDVLGLTFRKDLYLASSQVERYLSCVWRISENLLPPDLPPLGDWPGEQATPHQTPGETDQKAGW